MTEFSKDQSSAELSHQIGAVGVEAVTKVPIPPIGQRIPLPVSGATLERLNPDLLAELQAKDSRVRYVPANASAVDYVRGVEQGFMLAITTPLAAQIEKDFPDTTLMIRGTSAAVHTSFPFWTGYHGEDLPMNSVADILARGSDRDSDTVQVSIKPYNQEVHEQTVEWLFMHHASADLELTLSGDKANADQTFPVLLVYAADSFINTPRHGQNELAGNPSERIAAIYITDKIVHS